MSQTAQKSTSNFPVRNLSIVLAVAIICFLIGGGWHRACNPDDIYGYFHSCYSPREKLGAIIFLFLSGGGAAGTTGAVATIIILKLLAWKKRA